ncbi:alpha/beta hydrolase [Streptomyces sp. NPDC006925]|uniref:alpha/beta hydrolase n=1 Tax=Streptomyces sp. NPDC006925 TaxID=3364768 RepID=UPI003681D416
MEAPASAVSLDVPAAAPQAAVLVLHGGRADGLEAPPPWNLPGARMRPFVRMIGRATAGQGVVLGTVRYRHRGWNGDRQDAARDARQALAELVDRVGELPVVLLGHSMGGRAALRVAGHPSVRGVVGLAPWCPPGEPVAHLAGSHVALVHGDRDRTTDPRASEEFVRRARAGGAEARMIPVPGGDHAMLRRPGFWHRLTTRLVTGLLDPTARPPRAAAR